MDKVQQLRKGSLMSRRLQRGLSIGTSSDDVKTGLSPLASPLMSPNRRSPSHSGKRGSRMTPVPMSPALSPVSDPLGREVLGRLGELEIEMLHKFVKHWAEKQLKHAWTSWYNIDNQERRKVLNERARKILLEKAPLERSEEEVNVLVRWVVTFYFKIVKGIAKSELPTLCKALRYRKFKRNQVVFLQCEMGRNYYICLGGSVLIFADKDEALARERLRQFKEEGALGDMRNFLGGLLGENVKRYGAGGGFGEVALFSSNPLRNASAVADRTTELLIIDKETYMATLADSHQDHLNLTQKLMFLPKVDLFKSWSRTRLVQICYGVVEETVKRNSVIVRQGDVADQLILLKSGRVREVIKGAKRNPYKSELAHSLKHNDTEVSMIGPGSFVGEVVLRQNSTQPTTCIAQDTCVLLFISQDAYNKFIRKTNTDFEALRRISDLKKLQRERRMKQTTDFKANYPESQRPKQTKKTHRHFRSSSSSRMETKTNTYLTYEDIVRGKK